MKMKMIVPTLTAAALLCSMTACANSKSEPSPYAPTPVQSETPVSVPPSSEPERRCVITADIYDETFLSDDGVTELMYVSYAMPVVTVEGDDAASAKISGALSELKQNFLHSQSEYDISVDSALADARSAREQGYDGSAYAMEQTFTIPRADSAAISILNSYYSNLGGPHPNTVLSAISFDLDGERISLSDLSGDAEGFKSFCTEKILALAERDAGDGRYYDNYKELIPNNIRDDMWYFSREGLTFIYNAYDIGTHASGGSEFTIPYSELSGVLDSRWLPAESDANGSVSCDFAENTGSFRPLLSLTIDDEGSEFVFTAQGTVRNVQVSAAAYDGEQYLEGGSLACVTRMDDGEGFSLRYLFPGDMSCLCLRYTTGSEQITRYIQISGEDGSVLMTE